MMDHRGAKEEAGRPMGPVGIIQGVVQVSGTRVLVVKIFWRQVGWMWSVRDREQLRMTFRFGT